MTLELAAPVLRALGVSLRRQVPDDAAFLRDLYAAQRASELAMVPWDDATRQGFIDQQFAAQQAHFAANRPDADYLIVERATPPAVARAIGRLYVDRTGDPWRLAELALLPEATGGGIGTALVGLVIDAARAAGATGIDLHVAIDNARAAGFYSRAGFGEVDSSFGSHRRFLREITVS